MTEYNEGARGRARYWMERAQRAEAECERLREGVKAVRDDIQAWGERAWNNRAAAQATRWTCDLYSALATPPPEGEYSIRCVICDASVRPEDGGLCDKHKYDEQSHGDALAALDRLIGAGQWTRSTEPSAEFKRDYAIVRRHLTASGVPYVPENVPAAFVDWLVHEMPSGTRIHDPGWWAPRIWRAVRRAIAAAPTDGRGVMSDCDHKCCVPWYSGGIKCVKCLKCGRVLGGL